VDLTNVPEHTVEGLLIMNADAALREVSVADVLTAYQNGVSIQKQADALGCTNQAIYKKILAEAPKLWKEYQSAHALARLDDSERMLENATDGVGVGRARELARLQCWKLERVLRQIYGTDGPQVAIQVNVGDVSARILELEAELGVLAAPHTT